MILPKGIVENTREIYAEVASYPIVPPEKIWQYWNGKWSSAFRLLVACRLIRQTVYTTTFRRLVDPTAYRLENFWWHVWGSDRRYLSGPELARLFEEFTLGPTFVPLRSPANRYEGPPVRAHRIPLCFSLLTMPRHLGSSKTLNPKLKRRLVMIRGMNLARPSRIRSLPPLLLRDLPHGIRS
jgi:hypothetical protein